jgi:hypothetical protein
LDPEKKPEDGAAETPAADAPKYVTEDQLDKALTARLRAVEQKVEKTVAQSFDTFSTKLKTELASLFPPPKAEAKADAKKEPVPPDPELTKLKDQVTTLTQQAADARAERDTERAKARDATLRQKLGELLGAAGIEGVRARHVIGLLVDSEHAVRWSDDGDGLVFRTADRGDVELETGLRTWLKSDDAKVYLPPKGTQGSGDRPAIGGPSTRPTGPPERRDVADGLRRALLGQM